MVHIVLTGATGLVGSAVLHHILSLPAANPITKLSILSRSPVPAATSPRTPNRTNTTTQIDVITHRDYLNYPPSLLSKLSDVSAVIWAQGISATEVSASEYRVITHDYPLAAARALATAARNDGSSSNTSSHIGPSSSPPLNFVYVSGEGATHQPGFLTQVFARVKGEAELALLDLPSQQPSLTGRLAVYCVRPGGIYSDDAQLWQQSLARRNLPTRVFLKTLMPVLGLVKPSLLIPVEDLARVLVEMALREGGVAYDLQGVGRQIKGVGLQGRVLQNVALRELAGLKV